MTQSPNEAKSILLQYRASLQNNFESNDESLEKALVALRSLIEKEVIDTKRDLYITHSNKDFVDGYSAGRDDLRSEQRAKLKEVMRGEL